MNKSEKIDLLGIELKWRITTPKRTTSTAIGFIFFSAQIAIADRLAQETRYECRVSLFAGKKFLADRRLS
jgi:hypothetical protein